MTTIHCPSVNQNTAQFIRLRTLVSMEYLYDVHTESVPANNDCSAFLRGNLAVWVVFRKYEQMCDIELEQ